MNSHPLRALFYRTVPGIEHLANPHSDTQIMRSLPFLLIYALTGDLILSDATYAGGIGFFDKVAINYGYRVFTEMDENPLLERLIDDAEAEGYMFLTDQVKINGVFVMITGVLVMEDGRVRTG